MGAIIQSVAGGIDNIASNQGSENARDAMLNADGTAISTVQGNYNANAPNYQKYIDTGQKALGTLDQQAGPTGNLGRQFTTTDFHKDPAYQFDMQQGLNAISNSNSVRGGSLSGGTMKALTNYGEQQASNEYQNAYSRFTQNQNQNFSQLNSLSNQGLTATAGLSNLGANTSTQVANLQVGAGQAQANDFLAHAANFVKGNDNAANAWGASMGSSQGSSGVQGLSGFLSAFSG
jgi:hypothetical protein